MSGNNISDGAPVDGDGVEQPEETFHIYILSFSYGFLVLVFLGHLLVRWKWRRVKASRFPNHYPGDRSFKSKAIRQRLQEDFRAINELTPDPKLIHEDYEPAVFGHCKEGESVPTHWYRMKTCEMAAAFVSENKAVLVSASHSSESTTRHPNLSPLRKRTTTPLKRRPSERHNIPPALSDFVTKLKEMGRALHEDSGEEREVLVNRACELYTFARFKDGEFPASLFQEFTQCLEKLQDIIFRSSPAGLSPSPTGMQQELRTSLNQPPEWHRFSMEPLLASSQTEFDPTPQPAASQTTPKIKDRRAATREGDLSPLILVEPPSFQESSFMMPETPV